MKEIITVDDYINTAAESAQPKLREIRQIIKSVAPEAKERISYGMPFYEYKGRLVYFGLQKNHIGLYIPPPIIENFREELKGYKTTISAIHLSLDKELPAPLISNLVKARMVFNETKGKN